MGDVQAKDSELQQKIQATAQDVGTNFGDAAGTAMLMGVGKDRAETPDPMRMAKEVLPSVDNPVQAKKSSLDDVVDYITDKIWPWK
jgi:hypothetical protein